MKERMPTCIEIECLVARLWGYRQNIIVPNISWGAGLHECDLLVLSKAGYATEVEIKISRSDLKKDASKGHGHESDRIRYLYFALPEKLLTCLEFVPQRAGVIAIRPYLGREDGFYAEVVRQPEINTHARKWSDRERSNLGRLGCMQIWSLKSSLIGHINSKKQESV